MNAQLNDMSIPPSATHTSANLEHSATVKNTEIHSMTNYSRDYAIMKFEVRVPFETDVEKVRKLIKQVGAELAQNEEHASVMLEPLKSQGVSRMDDSAFVIRCKFTTVPGKQFTVRRVAYAMIQEAFAREGIKFAPRRVVVETVAPAGSPEALAAAAAAATAAPAKTSARRRHGEKKIKIFTKTWKTNKLQKTSKKSMEIDKNNVIDFGGAGKKRTSPSNSTRKTTL